MGNTLSGASASREAGRVDDDLPQVPAWQIRPYQPGDEAALVRLFERVFGRPLAEDHWRWKLKQPLSPVENVWLAVHAGEPIFQYAGIPTAFVAGDREMTVMVSVDTMTAPEFQRRGLLSQVGTHTYTTWQAAGIPMVLGLPNERWGTRAAALGWEPLFKLQWYLLPLSPARLLARHLRLPTMERLHWADWLWTGLWAWARRPGAAVQVMPISEAGEVFDRLWQHSRGDYGFSVRRDARWVNWRYLSAPEPGYRVLLASRDGQPIGYAAYRLETAAHRKVGMLADLFTPRADGGARRSLLAHVLHDLRAAGAESVATLAIPASPVAQTLRAAGFLVGRWGFVVQCVLLDPRLAVADMRDPQLWSLAGGDFDVV
jgi:Acetyltransferase (GNAT) domain